jgi:hypothetical protein
MKIFKLKKTGLVTWTIYGPLGNQIGHSLNFENQYQAQEYMKAYLSSWGGCTYELILDQENSE